MSAPIRLSTLWIGPALGRVERACLRSALAQGHAVTLYCYRAPEGVPAGVELRDAADVLPETAVIRHRGGSPSLFSNRFRYVLQQRGLGTWIDADLYLVAPIDGERPTLFGWQSGQLINGAVLRLPADSPLLAPLVALFAEREVPFWLEPAEREAAAERLARTGRTGLGDMPWGAAGPLALTALARLFGLEALAVPRTVFYPMHFRQARWIGEPGIALEEVVRPDTVAIHLWNELIKDMKEAPAMPGSFLARLHAEGA